MDFLSFRITSSYIVPFSCTYNGHQKSNCLLISSKLDVVKSLWNRLQSIVPDRIENGEKPCISKDFLVLCFTSRRRIGATPKRKVGDSNSFRRANIRQSRSVLTDVLFILCKKCNIACGTSISIPDGIGIFLDWFIPTYLKKRRTYL